MASTETTHAEQRTQLRKMRHVRENLTGYLFVAPAVILIGMFGIFPVLFTIFVSLHKWRIKRGRFLGLANYKEAFGEPLFLLLVVVAVAVIVVGVWLFGRTGSARRRRSPPDGLLKAAAMALIAGGVILVILSLPRLYAAGDDDMFDSLRVTIWYAAGAVPVQLAGGLLLAVLLNQKVPGKQVFRVIYLLPYLVPSVAAAVVFERLFSLRPESFANQVLLLFGGKPLQWLLETKGVFNLISGGRMLTGVPSVVGNYWLTWAQGPSLALVSIIFFNWWVFMGYYALIYTNGLSNIPRQLYEAAEIDGAGPLAAFFRITIPLLSPSTYFLSLLGVIGTFKAFNHIFVLRNPAARGAVDTMSIQIFFTFFRKQRFGYAAAMSLFLFVIVIGLTIIQRRIMERRVTYGD